MLSTTLLLQASTRVSSFHLQPLIFVKTCFLIELVPDDEFKSAFSSIVNYIAI